MSQDEFRLILRYSLDPANAEAENRKRLLEFVDQSKIHEVMFLIAPEERSCGHVTLQEAAPWIQAIQTIQPELQHRGVAVSLNPWTTTYHAGRGRRLHPGQEFRLMVGETGATNCISPCPFDTAWQLYLIEYYTHLAQVIDPVAIWIEDDWRLHNHGVEMGYGGCFCDVCRNKFATRAGVDPAAASRAAILEKVLQPGPPHPWRQHWLDLAREALLQPAEHLAAALRAARPALQIGLMSSIPDVHSVEGRDWNKLMATWSGPHEFLIRPHMPPYTETPPMTTWPSFTRHTIANLDRPTTIYPELENSPRCGQYSGSHAYTAWEMSNAILLGSRGITLNHFDNTGMNTWYDRGLASDIARRRPVYDTLMPLHLTDRRARGVKVLFAPDIARHRHATHPTSLNGLVNESLGFSGLFYVLGISHSFTKTIADDPHAVYAVSDQTLRAFDDAQLRRLLAGAVILDLPSVQILLERGFGPDIGVQSAATATLNETGYSLEELAPDFLGPLEGGVVPRMCAQRIADPIGVLQFAPTARILSMLKQADLSDCFPGAGLFRNARGGRILSLCYPLGKAQFYMAYFNRLRQHFWTRLLMELGGANATVTIAADHPLQLHALDLMPPARGLLCGLTNVIYDPATQYTLHLPARDFQNRRCQALTSADPAGRWQAITPHSEPSPFHAGYTALTLTTPLAPLETLYLRIE